MRVYNVIRNDRAPTTVKAEKVLLANDEYIFSHYDTGSGYDVVVATIHKGTVVEMTSEEVQSKMRMYQVGRTDGTVTEITAECTKVVEGEMVFMNYDDTYSTFTTVSVLPMDTINSIKVVD